MEVPKWLKPSVKRVTKYRSSGICAALASVVDDAQTEKQDHSTYMVNDNHTVTIARNNFPALHQAAMGRFR
jgi:hypothetical protein